ncbi:MAG: thioredoxin fold domain-containing protein [Gammaproteobacteria bacterium]|nr:thioredoxin fold domain-containing protein [Gammaproteobacteria bacterium]
MLRSILIAFALLLPLAAGAETPQEPAAVQKPAAKKPGAPKPEQKGRVPAAMLAEAPMSAWMRDGQSKHVIYVFFDPNCPYCHKLYENLRDAVALGDVELRWIPVGISRESSLGKAAAMLEAKSPIDAFHYNEQHFTFDGGKFGGLEEEPLPKKETLQKLADNLTLLKKAGTLAVPAMLFRTQDGTVRYVPGAPPIEVLENIVRNLE